MAANFTEWLHVSKRSVTAACPRLNVVDVKPGFLRTGKTPEVVKSKNLVAQFARRPSFPRSFQIDSVMLLQVVAYDVHFVAIPRAELATTLLARECVIWIFQKLQLSLSQRLLANFNKKIRFPSRWLNAGLPLRLENIGLHAITAKWR